MRGQTNQYEWKERSRMAAVAGRRGRISERTEQRCSQLSTRNGQEPPAMPETAAKARAAEDHARRARANATTKVVVEDIRRSGVVTLAEHRQGLGGQAVRTPPVDRHGSPSSVMACWRPDIRPLRYQLLHLLQLADNGATARGVTTAMLSVEDTLSDLLDREREAAGDRGSAMPSATESLALQLVRALFSSRREGGQTSGACWRTGRVQPQTQSSSPPREDRWPFKATGQSASPRSAAV